jgi:hypothetical protein
MRRKMARMGAGAALAVGLLFAGGSAVHAQPIDPTTKTECSSDGADVPGAGCYQCTTNSDGQRECYGKGLDCVRGDRGWTCIPERTSRGGGYRPPSSNGQRRQ